MNVFAQIFLLFTIFLRETYTQVTSCTSGTVGVNPTSYRSSTSSHGANSAFLLEDPLYQITCCGAITSWEVATSGSGGITLQVWRKLSVNVYQLVGQNVFFAGTGTLTPADRIMVQHGDYIGWLSNGATMKYGSGSAVLNRVVTTMTSLQTGDYYDWSGVSPEGVSRNYAIKATISASTSPAFGTIPSLVTFPEETPQNTVVYSFTITDADTTDVLNLYTKSETSGFFAVDTSTYQIKTLQDHIPLGSAYKVAVKVVDSCHKEASATVTLSVSNSDISMSISPTTSTVLENSSGEQWLADLVVADPMNRYSCSLQTANVPFIVRQNSSGILGYSLYLRKWPQLDTSVTSSYTLRAECTDGTNTKTATHTVSVTVNSKPTISNLGSGVTVSLDARTVLIGHFVYNVTALDNEGDDVSFTLSCSPAGCPFKIYDSGAILLTSRLITHSVSFYTLTVRVRDAYTGSASSGTLTVSITNRNTTPSLTIPALTSLSENSPPGHSVLTVTSSDVESGALPVYGLFTPAYGLKYFDINETTGVVTTSTSENIDYDIISTKDIVLVVYTSDGIAVTSQTGTIRILDVNEPCNFTEDYYRIIREEGTSGSVFPLPDYNIIDPDDSETFTFQKNCGVLFDGKISVDTTTGQFSLAVDYDLDIPGTSDNFNCTLTVTDSAGHTDTTLIGVFIEYKNEFAPTFSLSSVSLTLQSHAIIGAIVANFTAQDNDLSTQDDGRFYYILDQSSNTKEYFGIMSNGSIYIKEDLTPLYLGRTLSMTLTAKDYGNPSRQSSLAITIQIPVSTTTLASASTDKSLKFEEDNKNAVFLSLVGLASLSFFCTLVILINKCHQNMTRNLPKYNLLQSEPVGTKTANTARVPENKESNIQNNAEQALNEKPKIEHGKPWSHFYTKTSTPGGNGENIEWW